MFGLARPRSFLSIIAGRHLLQDTEQQKTWLHGTLSTSKKMAAGLASQAIPGGDSVSSGGNDVFVTVGGVQVMDSDGTATATTSITAGPPVAANTSRRLLTSRRLHSVRVLQQASAGATSASATLYLAGSVATGAEGYTLSLTYLPTSSATVVGALGSNLPSTVALRSGIAQLDWAAASSAAAASPPALGGANSISLAIPTTSYDATKIGTCLLYDTTTATLTGGLTGLSPGAAPAAFTSYDSATGLVTCNVTAVGAYVVAQGPESIIPPPPPAIIQAATVPAPGGKEGLSSGAVAGIVIGSVVGTLLIVALVAVLLIRRRQQQHVAAAPKPVTASSSRGRDPVGPVAEAWQPTAQPVAGSGSAAPGPSGAAADDAANAADFNPSGDSGDGGSVMQPGEWSYIFVFSQLPPYGTAVLCTPAQGAPAGRGPSGVHIGGLAAIDTPTFNADQHTSDILRIFSLEKLMVEHRNMAREIKNIDSDMQQLVYENYNKFITATDTIRTMKSSIDSMEGEMQRLQQTASVVAEKSLSVSNKLQQRRESMEQLYKVQRLLRKLQTVFELPRKMRAALEEDALDTAVGLYAEAQPLLHKYGGRGTFKVIALESDFVAQEISQLLKKRLTERKDDAEQCVLLLRKLGEPDDTLQDKYLSGRVARIKRVLTEAAMVADAMAAAAAASAGGQQQLVPPPPKAQLPAPESWGWTGGNPPQLRAFVRALDEKFINGVQETVVNVIRFFLPEGSEDSPEAAAAKRKPLVTLSRELFAEYFGIVRRVVTDAAKAGVLRGSLLREARAEAGKAGSSAVLSAIALALSTMSTDVGLLATHLPELQLKERALEVVQAAIQQHVTLSFAALKQRVIDAAVAGSAYLVELLQRGLAVLLQGLRGYESAGGSRLLASWRDQWVDLVQGGLQSFFGGLLLASLELAALR
ncbi:hypothetical protein VOLCADRAFT_120427 [Volvox carteri f. nagariensis]|uniref:Vacuolar protein sorting-associated protein 51 homolog n=1 Tax=Volvox carteri f. nagariensis TaxID=3068 RepID=D8TL69_VOLCA|nr:uncharacterized protein VOLCADRAFT_120427 [Volvox carteri f. nagariensis]EFJ51819.1 hypothetical protein VOLCADRAFT_120427 [Volvox carteri f. nagariensis]|eukprot:XP_002947229.1 hypothetical protein VOLCADRAFT_120427 [Volvox carteri f. nagariensis]